MLLFLNSSISFWEESNASNAAAALMSRLALKAKVLILYFCQRRTVQWEILADWITMPGPTWWWMVRAECYYPCTWWYHNYQAWWHYTCRYYTDGRWSCANWPGLLIEAIIGEDNTKNMIIDTQMLIKTIFGFPVSPHRRILICYQESRGKGAVRVYLQTRGNRGCCVCNGCEHIFGESCPSGSFNTPSWTLSKGLPLSL